MIQNIIVMILAALPAFVISAWLTNLLVSSPSLQRVLDIPGKRSLHSTPVPRTGGLAIFIAIVVAGVWVSNVIKPDKHMGWFLIATLLIATVSFLDDCFSLGAGYRIIVHAIAAGLLLFGGFSFVVLDLPGLQWTWPYSLGEVFTLLFVVWMLNLYNFMDGIDGIAGGMAVFGFGVFSIVAWQADNVLFSALSLAISASASGFLLFNFPPAKIFMGDIGSSTLGFLAAGFALWGSMEGMIPLWASALLFSPFIVDATVTLLRRLIQGKRIWEPHRTHYYQRLVQLGWGHRRTVLWAYCLMAGCAVSTLLALRLPVTFQWSILGFWCIFYITLMAFVHRLELEVKTSRQT